MRNACAADLRRILLRAAPQSAAAVLVAACASAGTVGRPEAPAVESGAVYMSVPVFDQTVHFGLPEGWRLALEKSATRDSYVVEFIPRGESLQRWSLMVTLLGFEGAAARDRFTVEEFVRSIATGVARRCGDQTVFAPLGPTRVDDFDAFEAIIGCARFDRPQQGAGAGQGEIAYYLIMVAGEDVYVLQHARRGDAFDKNDPPISRADVPAIRESLSPIRLCGESDKFLSCHEQASRDEDAGRTAADKR